ncbi:unnamed protein product [Microthlaspi erraticum]|uniref:C3H1-type domain-containing protein n=1 Tax=Microthlaspi erraticum TaxID=1685480 RepID=A0A6D2IJZ6_9BRAS|nr:unnamed protein product [Microthlaspi erraticum]
MEENKIFGVTSHRRHETELEKVTYKASFNLDSQGQIRDSRPITPARRSIERFSWRRETDSRSWAANRVKKLNKNTLLCSLLWSVKLNKSQIRISQGNQDSGLTINGANRVPVHRDSNADMGENLQQQRRSHETESRLWNQRRVKKLNKNSLCSLLWNIMITRVDTISQGNEDSGSRINEENLQQERVRDVDIPRRSHETESRFWRQQRDRSADRRGNSESKRVLDERQSSAYPNHGRVKDCRYFVSGQCRFGEICRFNHPSHILRAGTTDRRASEYETESRNRAKRRYIQENHSINAKDIMQDHIEEQRSREARDNLQEENLQQQRLREMQENQDEIQSQRDIERERRETRRMLDQVKPSVEFNDLSGIRDSLRVIGIERKEGDGF